MAEISPFPSPVDPPIQDADPGDEAVTAVTDFRAPHVQRDPGDEAELPVGDISSVAPEAVVQADPGDESDFQAQPAPEDAFDPSASDIRDDSPEQLQADLHTYIVSSLDLALAAMEKVPTRELAITITKLEEAEMWLLKTWPAEEVN